MRFFLLFLGACAGTSKDSAPPSDDSATGESPDCTDGGTVYLVTEDGTVVDLSPEAAMGTAAAPAVVTLTTPGTVHVCPGTWNLAFVVRAARMAFVGEGEADRPVLSGGGSVVVIDIPIDEASVSVTGLDITAGKGCVGSAIRAASVSECSRDGISPVAVQLSLSGVNIFENTYDVGGGAVGITHGGSLVMENTRISENEGHGVYAQEASVVCTGTPSDRSGSWGNTKYGIWTEFMDTEEYTTTSSGCDFGEGAEDNGFEDVMFNHDVGFEYGDDATFSCNSLTQSCL